MSQKYPGGFITKSPVAPTSTAASGIWTLDQQQQAQKAGTWPSPPIFIEDLFSTYVYTGTGASNTITNGVDLSGKGGLVWLKGRNSGNHILQDTDRGANNYLMSDSTAATQTLAGTNFVFGSTGFSMNNNYLGWNTTGNPYVSWSFAQQPKFFDIVTYTGNGSTGGQTINHNLNSTPGCIIVKQTDGTNAWRVYHQSLGVSAYLALNTTAASATDANNPWKTPTSTTFGVGDGVYWTSLNQSGSTYVAYLFAHNAGGFPVSGGGSTNGISCGSFTTDGSGNATVNLGYEPQWLLLKPNQAGRSWYIVDNMRGWLAYNNANTATLYPNLSNSEATSDFGSGFGPNATGFQLTGITNCEHIYVAIRRGPMKTPTTGTSVFKPTAYTGTEPTSQIIATGFTVDTNIYKYRGLDIGASVWSRLTSGSLGLVTSSTNAEVNITSDSGAQILRAQFQRNDGFSVGTGANNAGGPILNYAFQRAPGFFDVIAYTGTGANASFTHNLGVVPEMMIVKGRSVNANWSIYTATTGATQSLFFTDVAAGTYSVVWNDTAPTASVFTVGTAGTTNSSGGTYVAYLFATVAGVSKVGTYTGTGALQTVNCGFTSGARFVLIKRTDSTGGWYTYDSARGITSGSDPYFFMNSDLAEVSGTNYVDTDTTGFKVTAAAPAGLNANGGTYIFLAIA